MKIRSIIKNSLLVLAAASVVAFGAMGTAQAAQIPYENIETQAPSSAAFNVYTGVPAGVGNEADFVKLRRSNGDPTVPAVSNAFVDPVNATCNAGEMFDVRTYVHNGADDELNQGGNGPAVAHGTRVAMNAPLNVKARSFTFRSTISATNATAVNDSGVLNCSKDVRLELVPRTVKVYASTYGWQNGPDGAVNGSLPIGSRQPGSGDVWGCFADRVIVVYTVVVREDVPPTPPPTPQPKPPVVPTALPVTGAGDLVGIFTATTVAGALAYRFVWSRRFDV